MIVWFHLLGLRFRRKEPQRYSLELDTVAMLYIAGDRKHHFAGENMRGS